MRHGSRKLLHNIRKNPSLYLMVSFGIVWFLVFSYTPMFGLVIAFKEYRISKGVFGSDWVGLRHFIRFFEDYYSFRIVRNTFLLAFYNILFGFPVPIILAILINEVRNSFLRRTVQSISYFPHFISTVIVVGLINLILSPSGAVNSIVKALNLNDGQSILFLTRPEWFRPIYIISEIWQDAGWGSIIYLAAISGIDPQLYEAAKIDGANRYQCIYRITIPSLMPTIRILFIVKSASILSIGFEKVYLLYNPAVYETADVINTYVYRIGIAMGSDFSYSTAIGLFRGIISFVMLVTVNQLSKKLAKESLF